MANASTDTKVASILEKARALNTNQLETLVDELSNQLSKDSSYYPDWHRQAVREAVEALEADPGATVPAKESLAKAREALKRRGSGAP